MSKPDTDTVRVNVVCPFCKPPQEFVVELEVESAKERKETRCAVQSSVDVHCPFCNKFVRVTLDKELKADRTVLREL